LKSKKWKQSRTAGWLVIAIQTREIANSPDYQITLIEIESIDAFRKASSVRLAPHEPRRNVVTRGISLNELCGKRFWVGCVELEGLELCVNRARSLPSVHIMTCCASSSTRAAFARAFFRAVSSALET
jgi:hypothetical protein